MLAVDSPLAMPSALWNPPWTDFLMDHPRFPKRGIQPFGKPPRAFPALLPTLFPLAERKCIHRKRGHAQLEWMEELPACPPADGLPRKFSPGLPRYFRGSRLRSDPASRTQLECQIRLDPYFASTSVATSGFPVPRCRGGPLPKQDGKRSPPNETSRQRSANPGAQRQRSQAPKVPRSSNPSPASLPLADTRSSFPSHRATHQRDRSPSLHRPEQPRD